MNYSIYDYNSEEKLLQEQEIEEINNVKMSLLNTLVTKLNNAGIYFNSTSRIKSESSLLHKLETGKYSLEEGGRKIQDIIGIRINLFYLEDMDICEKILEETFLRGTEVQRCVQDTEQISEKHTGKRVDKAI